VKNLKNNITTTSNNLNFGRKKNRESFGTDAYIKYVKQFEDWEKDVEKRRMTLRQKAEMDRLASEREAEKCRQEMERANENEQIQKRNEEAAALAYAEEQSQYMAIHQRAIQEEQTRFQQQHSTHKRRQELLPHHHSTPGIIQETEPQQQRILSQNSPKDIPSSGKKPQVPGAEIDNSMMNVMKQMLSFVMDGGVEKSLTNENINVPQQKTGTASASHIPEQVPPPQETTSAPPQLWGNEGAVYSMTDPMFRRWNVRAAPPNFRVPYQPPPAGSLITPGWMTLKKLNDDDLVIFANPHQQPSGVSAMLPGGVPMTVPPPAFAFRGGPPINTAPPMPNMNPLFIKNSINF